MNKIKNIYQNRFHIPLPLRELIIEGGGALQGSRQEAEIFGESVFALLSTGAEIFVVGDFLYALLEEEILQPNYFLYLWVSVKTRHALPSAIRAMDFFLTLHDRICAYTPERYPCPKQRYYGSEKDLDIDFISKINSIQILPVGESYNYFNHEAMYPDDPEKITELLYRKIYREPRRTKMYEFLTWLLAHASGRSHFCSLWYYLGFFQEPTNPKTLPDAFLLLKKRLEKELTKKEEERL